MNRLIVAVLLLLCTPLLADNLNQLKTHAWYSGDVNCELATAPAVETFQLDASTYIFRQNKCLHYEAPFLYLFLGDKQAVLLDTGAIESAEKMPLASHIKNIMSAYYQSGKIPTLMVLHSHNHSDHVAGDKQFIAAGFANVIGAKRENVMQFANLWHWPAGQFEFDLGNRRLMLYPTPGHQHGAISVYDQQTQILYTGDTFYPGRLYVRDWLQFKASIAKLVSITQQHPVRGLLGAHIEIDRHGHEFEVGAKFHHNEAFLPLSVDDLKDLASKITHLDKPREVKFKNFRVVPVVQGR